ncbi:hypothetical protein B0T26DRAFT_692320 [Lasiosphaeria miniovina]|uniref:DUF8021 domain-containing protein n=1 Tax=Lasiosphaeria miniovina TaxID=1954250 RepID=A0AA40B3F6_9PEZI|nr:uncharacterized protein B0T26DRAFT_692320 [Lasiosphaeria miniovina]KAK0726931.1 hypothetical protein B0T26DRAFT_692320 [Lasiosphaeria miniovina]
MLASLTAWLALGTSTALAAPAAAATPAACSRATLQAHTETYLAAQAAGKPGGLVALAAPGLVYTEDGVARNIQTGVLATALRIDHNRSVLDTTLCATYSELIVTDAAHPRVIGTQLRFDAAGAQLLKAESLVTQPGDWGFNASGTLYFAAREDGKWAPIPAAEQDSRAVIQAAADAYLDLFNNPAVVVPWGTPCDRLEGSFYTGNGSATDSCDVGVPTGVDIHDRRYVIDETVGTVDVLNMFATRPDSHEFRVEKGKIRFVHTLTIMRNVTA